MNKPTRPTIPFGFFITLLIVLLFLIYIIQAPNLLNLSTTTATTTTPLTLSDPPGQSSGARLIDARPQSPPWCAAIVANPLPDNNEGPCREASRLTDDANSRCGRFFSQYQQDIWIWLALAQFMDKPGVYVDVGANSPAFISNSFFFDRCLGWKGICVEAQDKYHQGLNEHRTCHVASCVSDKEADVMFVHADDLGGIASMNKNVNGTEDWQEKARTAEKSTLHCVPLKKILAEQAITEVTYMSLDVEGAEYLVLKGIDWDNTHIAVITMEGNRDTPANKLLLDKGYRVMRDDGGDGFYVSAKAIEMVEKLKGKGYFDKIIIPKV